jgi:hypothetical protein
MTLGSIDTGDTLAAQFNPESLEEELGAAYQKLKVQGLSHQVKQFEHTEDWTAKFELTFDALSDQSFLGPNPDIQRPRRLLQSWVYPKPGSGKVLTSAPTRVLFVWPGVIIITAVITKMTFKHTRFNFMGADITPTLFKASLTVEEIRDTLLLASDVLRQGTVRPP